MKQSEDGMIIETEVSEEEMKDLLTFLIEYFVGNDYLAIKRNKKIYHFNIESLG